MAEKWPRLHIVDIPVFDSKDGTKLEDEEEYKIQARKLFHSLNVPQDESIERKVETDMSRAPSYNSNPVFDQLRKKVSAYSLKEFHEQYQRSRGRDLAACIGTYTTVWGIPCAHAIIARGNHPITPRDFDSHWLLNPAATLVEAVTKNPVLEKIDDLFRGVVSLPK
ncbi:hypothetical protein CPB97_000138, partial [Podila verticillata]